MPQAASKSPGIFICYRRDDTAGHAGRLYDRLTAHFGDQEVFIDVDLIKPGEDFVYAVEEAVGSCDVLLALIGRSWLASRNEGVRRLDNPDDLVRLEIAAALAHGIHVIPVLVQDTQMPRPEDLPEELRPLVRRNALELSDLRWNYDVDQLIAAVERGLARKREVRRIETQAEVKRQKKDRKEPVAISARLNPSSLVGPRREPEDVENLVAGILAETGARKRRRVAWASLVAFLILIGALLSPYARKISVNQPSIENVSVAQPSPSVGAMLGQGSGRLKDQGFKNAFGMEFVWVPPGEFMMGSDTGFGDEKPVHRVTIASGFYMCKYEVTQAQWQAVMRNNPSIFKGDDLPVEQVSWNDAQNFILKLNARNDGYIYHLPSEAEWEYAARATTTGDYAGDLDAIAWYRKNSARTKPVGEKQPNAFGLFDIQGNVWEWCQDSYHDTYKDAPDDGRAWLSNQTEDQVIRGGGWNEDAPFVRIAIRYKSNRGKGSKQLGFRVAAVRNQ